MAGHIGARGTPEERFWRKVQKAEEGCWIWMGALTSAGYGNFGPTPGTNISAHKFSYELTNGPVPAGMELDHLCRARCCVRPDHLEAVTHRENDLRGNGISATNFRKTHCANGHALTPENVRLRYRGPNGVARRCRQCELDGNARHSETAGMA